MNVFTFNVELSDNSDKNIELIYAQSHRHTHTHTLSLFLSPQATGLQPLFSNCCLMISLHLIGTLKAIHFRLKVWRIFQRYFLPLCEWEALLVTKQPDILSIAVLLTSELPVPHNVAKLEASADNSWNERKSTVSLTNQFRPASFRSPL